MRERLATGAPKGNRHAVGNRGGTGAPAIYDPEKHPRMAARACRAGFIDQELAELFGVSLSAIDKWKQKHPEFRTALQNGKCHADLEVTEALYHRATGYSHEAVKIFNTEEGPVYAPYTEHYPPDTGAATFWLKNRQPEKWRDRVEVTGDGVGDTHYHIHMDMPGTAKVREDRGYRDCKTIEHKAD